MDSNHHEESTADPAEPPKTVDEDLAQDPHAPQDHEAPQDPIPGQDATMQDGESSSSDDEGDDAAADPSQQAATHEDGHEISEYERQRLERIQRNQAYLAQLGLEDLKPEKPKPRPKKKEEQPIAKSRFSSRATTKKTVSYAEPSLSVAALVREHNQQKPDKKIIKPPKEPKKKKKAAKPRMERTLYDEFQRLHTHKKQVLKQMERDVRAAEKEVKFWSKRADALDRKEQRKSEAGTKEQQSLQEREILGGFTKKELVQEVDARWDELLALGDKYDEEFEAEERARERQIQRIETEARNKTLDALDRFPKALNDSHSLLNTLLLQRLPKDPPPPRRSRRSSVDPAPVEAESSPKKKRARSNNKSEATARTSPDQAAEPWHDVASSFEHAAAMPPSESHPQDGEEEEKEAPGNIKIRSRSIRNVGGWISPNMAKQIDRSWLELDRPVPSPLFDPGTYAPQVGEAILYYPIGHKEYLETYPDVLGKKLRSMQRVPLWERPVQFKANGNESESTDEAKKWWSEQWLESMDDGTAAYPILCRVEKSYAEFPPDPFTKVVKTTGTGENAQILWKAPKDPAVAQQVSGTPLRLALVLRPLTPVVPPTADSDPTYTPLPLPPTFSVVAFPSKLKPFILPFSYAYSVSHSLFTDQKVTYRDDGSKAKVSGFALLGDRVNCRFDDKLDTIASIVARVEKAVSITSFLEEAFTSGSKGLPIRDCHVVVDTLQKTMEQQETTDLTNLDPNPVDVMSLISRTLPLWNGVCTMRNVYDRKSTWVSPWEIRPRAADGISKDYTPDGLATKTFDEALRRKIETVVEDFAWDNQEAGDLLYYPVTDEVAPSYSCAVPLGMCLEKILSRFGDDAEKDSGCFYRGVEHVLADINLILENCLLYNSPDSPVVESASIVIPELKELVSRASQDHYHELLEARRADEERRKLVMRSSSQPGEMMAFGSSEPDAISSRGPMVTTLRQPYKDRINQEWLQDVSVAQDWVPQAGDHVQYSPSKHSAFVRGHYPSLEPEQCVIPSCFAGFVEEDSHEIQGKIVWTRASFPKAPSKRSNDDQATFPTSTTLLAIGIQSVQTGDIFVVYYRPCGVKNAGESADVCSACALDGDSFLRLETAPLSGISDDPLGLPENSVASIEQCLHFLKRRCIKRESPLSLDPNLDKLSVKRGYMVRKAKTGLKNLPSYQELLFGEDAQTSENKGTRGLKLVVSAKDNGGSILALSDTGFLPNWASQTDQQDKSMTVSPWPKMSLEIVLLRLKNGYYRHRSAISNDIAEAFISLVITTLSEPASRKKAPILAKRVARLSTKATIEIPTNEPENKIADEEYALASRIKRIRELHAMALVAVTDTSHVERLFGLDNGGVLPPVQISKKSRGQNAPNKDPVREEARRKLSLLLDALDKDQLLNIFGQKFHGEKATIPKAKLRIVSEGLPVSHAKYLHRVTTTPAETEDGRTFDVTIRCNRKVMSWLKDLDDDVDASEIVPDDDTGTAAPPPLKYNDVRLSISCGGKKVGKGNEPLVASVSGRLGDKALIRKVEDYINFGIGDYEASEDLVKFVFGRPDRMYPCARCTAYRRSLFICRVRRSHSNPDYDWISNFECGGGIDGLLKTLDPDYTPKEPEGKTETANGGSLGNPSESAANAKPSTEKDESKEDEEDDDADEDDENKEDEDESNSDPREQLEKAKKTLEYGRKLLKQAKEYAKRPVRFDKDFIEAVYPVDPSDNHYIYCIICGLSGDLLCCDGCSNVVHSHCIELDEVPDDDWYCEECSSKLPGVDSEASNGDASDSAANKVTGDFDASELDPCATETTSLKPSDEEPSSVPSPNETVEREPANPPASTATNDDSATPPAIQGIEQQPNAVKYGPFLRAEFDDAAAERLSTLLFELNEARPERCRLKLREEPAAKDAPERDDNESESETQKRGGRRRRSSAVDEEESPSPPQAKKSRARKAYSEHPLVRPAEEVVELEASRFGRKRSRTQFLAESTLVGNFYASAATESNAERSPRRNGLRSPRGSRKSDITLWDDPFDRLSANTQSFLGTVGISNAEEFLATKTGDIADALILWREKERLPVLKGTGAIATISGWKSQCREAAREMGLDDLVAIEAGAKKASKRDSTSSRPRKRSRRRNGDNDEASDPIESLSATAQEFLRALDIESAEALLAARTGDVATDLVEWRKSQGMPRLKGTGSIATVSAWKSHCRKGLDIVESAQSTPRKPKATMQKNQKSPARRKKSPPSRTKRKQAHSEPESGSESDEKEPSPVDPAEDDDPISSLVEYAQAFLQSRGINKAEEFLETRSGDLAKHYVKWRKKNGMAVLKGSGPCAHIGAWKSTCRKSKKRKRVESEDDSEGDDNNQDEEVLQETDRGSAVLDVEDRDVVDDNDQAEEVVQGTEQQSAVLDVEYRVVENIARTESE